MSFIVMVIFGSSLSWSQNNLNCENGLKPKLAQMFYVWVKNRGAEADPAYLKFVKDFHPGGILLSGYSPGITLQESARVISEFKGQYRESELPPLVGADYLFLRKNPAKNISESPQQLGMGTNIYGQTQISELASNFRKICLQVLSKIKGVAHRIIGLNHPLGPIVEEKIDPEGSNIISHHEETNFLTEAISESGAIPTLKHYPFTVKGVNNHNSSLTLDLSADQIEEIQKNFLLDKEVPHVVMTTHFAASNVDGGRLATFSPEWIGRLRKITGPDNLIMTDGLFMIGNYAGELSKLSGVDEAIVNRYSKVKFDERRERVLVPWQYSYEPCFKAIKGVLRKYQKEDLTMPDLNKALVKIENGKAILSAEWEEKQKIYGNIFSEAMSAASEKLNVSKIEADQKCSVKIIDYVNLMAEAKGSFQVDEIHNVSNQIYSSFAERAILAGHDLLVMEGAPDITKATHTALIRKACSASGAQLKDRIEESFARISKFKEQTRPQLVNRAAMEWIEKHKDVLNELFFKIYPDINNPERPCRSEGIEAAEKALNSLCN